MYRKILTLLLCICMFFSFGQMSFAQDINYENPNSIVSVSKTNLSDDLIIEEVLFVNKVTQKTTLQVTLNSKGKITVFNYDVIINSIENNNVKGYLKNVQTGEIIDFKEYQNRRGKRSTESLVLAGGLAISDGPLPIGDLIATGIITYEAGKLVVSHGPNFWKWLKKSINNVFTKEKDIKDGTIIAAKFPKNTGDMDKMLGQKGDHKKDGPNEPGRKKTVWKKNKNEIVREKHPYDKDAPRQHRSYHWHTYIDGIKETYNPGDIIPAIVFEIWGN